MISDASYEEFDDHFIDPLTVQAATPGVINKYSAAMHRPTCRITITNTPLPIVGLHGS